MAHLCPICNMATYATCVSNLRECLKCFVVIDAETGRIVSPSSSKSSKSIPVEVGNQIAFNAVTETALVQTKRLKAHRKKAEQLGAQ